MSVSQAELTKIVKGFLLNSPPGEFMEVVTDVRGLLKNDNLLNSLAPTTFKEYNTDQMLKVGSKAGDHQVLICKYGEVGENEYLDPKGGQVVTFDHIKQEVTGSRAIGGELPSNMENMRKAFEDEAFKYATEHYENGGVAVYSKPNQIIVVISSSIFNPGNFWNGRWRSVWTAKVSGNEAELVGNIKINVHYYEDGNVQLLTDASKKKKVSGSDPSSLAAAALKAISSMETSFHSALETNYKKMGATTFKALRRRLPMTMTKIDWNKIQGYKLGQDMRM